MRRLSVLLVITLLFSHWSTPAHAASTKSLSQTFASHLSDVQVRDSGTVVRILSDDNKGSRHQRFILRVSSGQTILIAHNIDLAPKISSISIGDQVRFYGEYEWTRKGGVVHWTHHDPRARHASGWLKHKGKTYQ